jgi:hypothetical protein
MAPQPAYEAPPVYVAPPTRVVVRPAWGYDHDWRRARWHREEWRRHHEREYRRHWE